MTKTERYLSLLWQLVSSTGMRLSEDSVKEILGNPSRASYYRMISELTLGNGKLPAILTKLKDLDVTYFKLHQDSWQQVSTAQKEGQFYLECYKKLGHLLESDYTKLIYSSDDEYVKDGAYQELKSDYLHLGQKFIYLTKIQSKPFDKQKKTILNSIIKGLLEECEMTLLYRSSGKSKTEIRRLRPLTLCHYRDELYLLAQRHDDGKWVERTYKLQRIQEAKLHLTSKYKYPTIRDWNPEEIYKKTSGLIRGVEQEVRLKIYGHSRNILKEKNFYSCKTISENDEFIEYSCLYTNEEEFLGQIFNYAQDIEVIGPAKLKKNFIEKATLAINRNLAKSEAA